MGKIANGNAPDQAGNGFNPSLAQSLEDRGNQETKKLSTTIEIDQDKCVNCHACISACPVKYCNDGSGDHVRVDTDACIGCGKCIKACTHAARYYKDDFAEFLSDLKSGVPIVAIVAPSAASSFPGMLPNLIGWLESLGVKAVFDVSFGAELTTYSTVKTLQKLKEGMTVIASPCPAVVTYIQIYHPEIIPNLVPVASPMIHIMRMIRRYFPEYKDCRIAAISPCLAKKREFLMYAIGDYNIGYKSIQKNFEDTSDNLSVYPALKFKGPPAERSVAYSMPGGLSVSVLRHLPDMEGKIRRIEGGELIYPYLNTLFESIRAGAAPRLIDALSCDYGCNAGPMTLFSEYTPDEIEKWIADRKEEQIKIYKNAEASEFSKKSKSILMEKISSYWEEGLYDVKFEDLSRNNTIRIPFEEEKWKIFNSMHKYSLKDCHNCTACGYFSCEGMATAIYNGKNKPENCHFYLAKETENSTRLVMEREKRLNHILNTTKEGFVEADNDFRVVSLNPEMCKIIGRTNEEIIRHSLKEFTNEAGRYEFDRQREIRKQGRKSSYEITFIRPNGTPVHCLVSASPIFDATGAKTGSFALVTDITKLRMTLEELTELKENLEKKVEERTAKLVEANKDLESFSYSVSHDLRAPLRSIDGFSQALLEDFLDKLPEDGQDYLKRIRAATQKMGALIDDILSLSRVTRHVMRCENVDLSKLAKEIAKELCESAPARKVEFFIADDMVAFGDARLLEIALKNLIGNAWKFTSKKDLPQISFDYSDESGKRVYRVMDNGAGFDMKYIDKLFGAFQRLHDASDFPGTGIGLTIVRKIIQRHGGETWAEGAIGQGAKFYFTLDFQEEQTNEEEKI